MITSTSFHSPAEGGRRHVHGLDREKRLNALTFEVYEELAVAFGRSIVTTISARSGSPGRGKGFCSAAIRTTLIKHCSAVRPPARVHHLATGRLIKRCARASADRRRGPWYRRRAAAVIACASELPHRRGGREVRLHLSQVGLARGYGHHVSVAADRRPHARERAVFFGGSSRPSARSAINLVTGWSRTALLRSPRAGLAARLARGPAFAHAMRSNDRERAHDGARRGDRGRGAGPGLVHAAPGLRGGPRGLQGKASSAVPRSP